MIVLILLLCCYTLEAQNLPKFSYQAVVRNAENELVTNSPVTVDISVFNHQNFAEEIYTETHNVTSNLDLQSLGRGQPSSGQRGECATSCTSVQIHPESGSRTAPHREQDLWHLPRNRQTDSEGTPSQRPSRHA